MSELYVRNRQRTRPINVRRLTALATALIPKTGADDYRIGILLRRRPGDCPA